MGAQLMFISVEHASMDVVTTFLSQIHLSGRLSRIVVDECHLSVTWSNFRPTMNKLRGLKIYPVPLVLLSATVPPRMEQQLRIHFGSQFLTIRKPTVRPELQYQMKIMPAATDMDPKILRTLVRHAELLKNGRAIVFCLRKQETEDLAAYINLQTSDTLAGFYHGGMAASERAKAQDQWMSGNIRVMVATKAFGMGIDFPGIRIVIHKGMSSSILDYAQETGRGGRDGKHARCLTVLNHRYCEDAIAHAKEEDDKKERQEMHDLLKSSKCIRMQLGRYVDGKGYDCGFYPRSFPCSGCAGQVSFELVEDEEAGEEFESMEEIAIPEMELENAELGYRQRQMNGDSDNVYMAVDDEEEETM
jgi:superfamily II DNA helicase RecQ